MTAAPPPQRAWRDGACRCGAVFGIDVACLAGGSPFASAEVAVIDGVAHPSDTGGAPRVAGFLRFSPS
jgi:hypothetical protein